MTTHRRSTLLAVWRTYSSWWLTWAILAIYLAGLIAVVCLGWNHRSLTKAVTSSWMGTQWDALPADLTSVDSLAINANFFGEELRDGSAFPDPEGRLAAARPHYVFRPDSPLRIPGKFPNLKQIIVFASLNETQLIQLLEFQQLRSLTIVHLQPLTDRGWQALERQPLEELIILGIDRSLWNTGRWPRTVKKLLVQDDGPAPGNSSPPSHLAPLLNLPLLQTTEVRLWQDAEGNLRQEDLAVLSRMENLRTLYVDFFAPGTESRVQASLPHVAVRPANYESSRVFRVLQITGLGLVILLLILHLLSMQFVSPAAAIVPRFKAEHGKATCTLLIVWGLVQGLALMGAGCSPVAAIAMVGVCFIPIYLSTAVGDQMPRFPGYVNFPAIAAVASVSFCLIMMIVMAKSSEADWFFHGQRSDIAFVLLVLEAFSLVEIARFFQRLARRITETADGAVPFGLFAIAKMQAWNAQNNAFYLRQDRFWGRGQRMRLAAAIDCPSKSPQKQALLWRAGQPMTAVGFSMAMGFSMLVGAGVFSLILYFVLRTGVPFQNKTTLLPLLAQPLLFTLMVPAIILAQKRPFLAQHLLQSCTRREWVRLVFLETARDFTSAFLALSLGLGAYAYLSPGSWWPTPHVALISLALLGLLYCGILYGVTLSFAKQVIFALLGTVALIVLIFLLVAGMQSSLFHDALAWPPTWWLLGLPLAGASIFIAHDRWMKWELA